MSRHQCTTPSALSLGERQHALMRIAWDRRLLDTADFYGLMFAQPSHDLIELLFDLIEGQPDALTFLRRAVQIARDAA